MKYDCLLWDFNGTLLDDVEPCLSCLNTLLERRKLKKVEIKEYKELFTFPIIDYYRKVFDLEKEPYEGLAVEWTELYRKNEAIKLYEGAKETLKALSGRGIRQIILSASEKETLLKQLKQYGIFEYFDEVLALDNIHAETKEKLALDWRRRNEGAKAVMIGDTLHDRDVAKAIGADCVLIPKGHQSKEKLKKAAFLCEDISLIPDFLENL